MDFAFDEAQLELRSSAAAFLGDHSGSEQVRAAMETELGYDPRVWKQIASELGWSALLIPESYGGLGLGYVELVALMEIMGGSLLCAPFFSSICMGANALLVAGSEAQKQRHLPGIAAGETLAALAHAEAGGDWDAAGICATARRDGDEFVLNGTKSFVVDGHAADLLIVATRIAASRGADGIELFLVSGHAPGLETRVLTTMDQTRRLAEVKLDDVRVPPSARLGADGSAGWPELREILDRAAIALAAEQVGGAQKCLDMAVNHALQREQFGRPIASFQAIKHKCADMMVLVESARSASYYAGCVAAEDGDELPAVASLAKAYCSEAYFKCAAECLQIHGKVGVTWETDVQLYLKRARSSESLLGDASYHRERVAQQIGL